MKYLAALALGWLAGATTAIAILMHGEFDRRHPMGGPRL